MPEIEVIDMRAEKTPSGCWLSPRLRDTMARTFADGEQAMLCLNRRGYAPLTLCRTCGHRMQCPRSTACVLEHRLGGRLQCHHFAFNATPPDRCPGCQQYDPYAASGPVDDLDHASPTPKLGSKIGIDATAKGPLEGRVRAWPPDIVMTDDIKALVDRKWQQYGL